MTNLCRWFQGLGVLTVSTIALCGNSAIAQITQDGTLTSNSQMTSQENIIHRPVHLSTKFTCAYDEDGNFVCV
ncbi:MAG: hypothetical protein ACFKPT_04905 [Gloeotrichia echinulata GP01]